MRSELGHITPFLPTASVPLVAAMLRGYHVQIVVTKQRASKHGDYRMPFGKRLYHKITVNGSLNPYGFLLTLVHEIAHMHAFHQYGKKIAPHGIEWKGIFKDLAAPLFTHAIWPEELVPALFRYFKNPKASSSASPELVMALSKFDKETALHLSSLEEGSFFYLKNRTHQVFQKQQVRRTRVLCLDVVTKKQYAIHKMADVVQVYEK